MVQAAEKVIAAGKEAARVAGAGPGEMNPKPKAVSYQHPNKQMHQ